MNDIRVSEQLTDTEPLKNAPPIVAFTTVALGGFRGLVADWLWLRSTRMQERGNYFELVQLASWIVKLQPRFTGAHAFLAWNMSYNISVTFSSFEDRWRWVRRGIELIRDEALVYNPGDPKLFRELGWIYQHKLGKDLDDANRHYKTEMAKQMIQLFGDYPPDWQALADSPHDVEGLRETIEDDAALWRIIESRGQTLSDIEDQFRIKGELPEELAEELEKEELRDPLELYLRRRWMVQTYKLLPDIILSVNEQFPNLDWRLPEAHAIYWARRGLDTADKEISIECDRMIFQSLSAAFKGGRLVYIKEIQHLEMTPNTAIVDTVDQSYLTAIEKYEPRVIRGAYMNFLVDASVVLYTFGQKAKSREYFKKGKKEFPDRFKGDVERFVLEELAVDMALATYNQAQGTIQGFILQSCHALAIGDDDQAYTYERMAEKLWHKYLVDIGESTKKRRGLPPYKQMKRHVVKIETAKRFSPGLRARLMAALGATKGDLRFETRDDDETEDAPTKE
ncbi:MAG: hypothetical protein HN742_05200 [Lentisphaerae bacterium]|nr:hypothetical protein [Lentisphaerota bacterium]MBT7841244.1 hypothetical protein [Lentisphaerota bacterium]